MCKHKSISLFLICTLLATYLPVFPIYATAKKTTVAVYELTPKNVSEQTASILSDVLRDAIFQTGLFEMLTKDDMKRILENMAEKQQLDSDCSTDACIAEIAGALGVEMMVTGSVGKIGKTYTINLRLIDTAVARTINTTGITCPCEEDVLIEKIKEAGLKLLKVKSEEELRKQELARKKEEKERKKREAAARKAEKARKKALARQAMKERARKIAVEKTVEGEPLPTSKLKEIRRVGGWVALGIGVVGGIVGLTQASSARENLQKGDSSYDDYLDTANKSTASDAKPDAESYYNNARNAATLSTVGYAVLGIGVSTWLLTRLLPAQKKEESQSSSLPEINLNDSSVSFSWRF